MSLAPARATAAGTSGAAVRAAGRPAATPRHVAIIMDGNGRWAKRRHLPRVAGHRAGVEAVRRIVEAAPDLGIEVLTLYAFSSENWKRPAEEVGDLMGLLRHYIRSELNELDANGVRLMFIGNYKALKPDLVNLLEDARERTRANTGLTLAIALNYGGQDEIVRAARALAAELPPERIDAAALEARLDTAGLPSPDLVVRTSGEQRLSNFLLWQAAYAEFVVTERLWPDFDAAALAEMVAEFATRERRFGGR